MAMDKEIKVSIEYPRGITDDAAFVTQVGNRLYRLELDPLLFIFDDEADDRDSLPAFRDIVEAEEIQPGKLKFIRIVERAKFKRFEFIVSEKFVSSTRMNTIRSRVEECGGYLERVFNGVLLIYLPDGVEYDPGADMLG